MKKRTYDDFITCEFCTCYTNSIIRKCCKKGELKDRKDIKSMELIEKIKKLREMSGQGMMDCKNALKEANENLDEAFEILAKNSKLDKSRKDRIVKEGRVDISLSIVDSKNAGFSIISLLCETDFLAKTEDFENALKEISISQYNKDKFENSKEVESIIDDIKAKSGENIELGPIVIKKIDSSNEMIGGYIHHDNKKASVVILEGCTIMDTDVPDGIAMQVLANKPKYANIEDVNWDEIDLEIPESLLSKPPQILEKITNGKKEKFCQENVLSEQKYIKDDSKKIKDVLLEYGEDVKIKEFDFIVIGDK